MKEELNFERSRLKAEVVGINLEDPLAQEALARLQTIVDDPDSQIDFGGAAIIHRLPNGVCMKVMKQGSEETARNRPNSLQEEARFNQHLSGVAKSGVRSPQYIGRINARSPRQMEAILMEELNAVNLQKVLNGTVEMPASFNVDVFLDSLAAYIAELNERLGIVHNDLEPRNVMIDITSGLPRIIDFGRSIWLKDLDEVTRKKTLGSEWSNLEKLESKVEEFVQGLTNKK